jgi:hypothetical protein
MVVGEDVVMRKIPSLLGRTTIGRFVGIMVQASLLAIWLDLHPAGLLGYLPIFHTLSRDWIVFKFNSKEDMEKIFSREWN